MFGLGFDVFGPREEWVVVLGRDHLKHWQRILRQPTSLSITDADVITFCGQTFFEQMPLPSSTVPITCVECATRLEDDE